MIILPFSGRQWPRKSVLAGFVILSVLDSGHLAIAQSSDAGRSAGDAAGRYTFQQTQDGVLRLDTQSGELSLCRSRDGKWSCETAVDDRRAAQEELAKLRAENAELKKDVKRLEELSGIPAPPDPDKPAGHGRGSAGVQLPTEEDLDKAMSYMQRMLKKFKEKLKEFESEIGKSPEPKKGTPL